MRMTKRSGRFLAVMIGAALIVSIFYRSIDGNAGQQRLKRTRRAPSSSPRAIRPVPGRTLVGAYDPTQYNGASEFTRDVGAGIAVVNVYQAWADENAEFDDTWVAWAKALRQNGRVPMITWEPWHAGDDFDQPDYRLKLIAEGKHDAYLKRWFAGISRYDGPVFVRFAHEMNGFWYPWGSHVNRPADYVAAWRHVVKVGRRTGADNITWVWTPNETRSNRQLDRFYPGDDYVDWVGVSGFNWGGPTEDWAGWRSFSKIFDSTLTWLKRYRKPIMIAEMGSIENPQSDATADKTKAAWIEDAFKRIKTHDPSIGAVLWQNDLFRQKYDWRVDTSKPTLEAMRRALADPSFSTRIPATEETR